MLSPRAIALQGIGFTPILVALQGFGAVAVASKRPRANARFERYKEDVVSLAQLQQEDELVTDLLLTLVTKGFFNGTLKS